MGKAPTAAPTGVDVLLETTVKPGTHQRPEPDVLVHGFEECADDHLDWHRATHVPPEDVLIAIEVVSEESQDRDRTTKPLKYAAAGIPHFWRIEPEETGPAIHVYELDGARAPRYVPITITRERLKPDVPFPLDIDVRSLTGRR